MEKRVIKFRAWDKKTSKMLEWQNSKVAANSGIWLFKNGTTVRFWDDDIDIMQFTGLLDKNGVEIYEGDVDRFGWVVCFEDGVFCLKQTLNAKTFIAIHESNIDEIICNIYEHPNLLTEPTGK